MDDPSSFYRQRSARGDHTAPGYVPWRLGRALDERRPAGPVLEIGCGVGGNLEAITSRGLGAVGIDLSEPALAEAGAAHPTVGFAAADGSRLPFRDGAFGVIVVTEVLEHVRDPVAVAAEAGRVVGPGGLLFATSPNYANVAGLRKLWEDRRSGRHDWNPWGAHVGGYEAFMTRGRLRAAVDPWFEVVWEEGLDAGLGLSAGARWFARLATTGPGERALRRLGEGPLAPHRPLGRRLGMNTAILAVRR
ncbi:MAG: class I SAM-dependent methyltransferase [Actinomycetota bacterium]